jgi:hypothetical protein
MSNQTKLLIYSILSFVLFLFIVGCNHTQTATIAPNEDIETYSYIVTKIDNEGLHGQSTTDNTGIFLTPETIDGLQLKEGNKIKVSFPKDDPNFETITKVTKIN